MASLINSAGATGTGSMTIQGPNTNSNQVLTIPDATGTILVETALSSSTTNTVTNKIAINIGGTTYYLLASTSGT